ncbi:MAG: hypothetical protein JWR07_3684 [Nevskia sp.]|jgi:hypothetical protein|nr:hypothetical protein [Nevskia sp.]
MELINATGMLAAYTMGTEPSGRESVVVVVKGTFRIPAAGQVASLDVTQLPLVMADTFSDEPGFSSPLDESEFAPRKRQCDVLLQGQAYAPNGQPAVRVPVGVRIGGWSKTFAVVGERYWKTGAFGISASPPEPFLTQAITYDVAFGGVDRHPADTALHAAFMRNPIGRGWHKHVKGEYVDGTPLPLTEGLDMPVAKPDGEYAPLSLGPLGRSWTPRLGYAGTYDQAWLDNVHPFLPADFNDAYYQAAPLDQQIPYPRGGEEVVLVNLTPEGRTSFKLPVAEVPVVFFHKNGDKHESAGALDTIVLLPDRRLVTLTWRSSLPLKKNLFEIPQAVVGHMPRGWWRARELGKEWHPSLDHAVRARRQEREEEDA